MINNMFFLEQHHSHFEGVTEHLKHELGTLRVGQATPSLVENVNVLAYDVVTPLKQLASISTSDSRTLVIQPWDKSITKDIEKALFVANLGLTPVVDGQNIRLTMPPLTEERRKDMVKLVYQKLEQAKQSLRQARDAVRDKVVTAEKSKELSEDDRFRLFKDIDKLSTSTANSLQSLVEEKEKQIMTI